MRDYHNHPQNRFCNIILAFDAYLSQGLASTLQSHVLNYMSLDLSARAVHGAILGGWSWGFHAASASALSLEVTAGSVSLLVMVDPRLLFPFPQDCPPESLPRFRSKVD